MRAERTGDVAAFAARAVPFFEADEVRSTIPLGVLGSLSAGERFGPSPAELWSVRDGGRDVLFGLRTAPHPFALALGSPEHAALLGAARAEAERAGEVEALSGINAPRTLAEAFSAAFAEASGRRVRVKERLRLYDLVQVTHPASLPDGTFRAARIEDTAQIVAFEEAFLSEVHVPAFDVAAGVAREIAAGRVFVWEVGGRVVSMAKSGGETRSTARVRLVFTPREERGRGYAGASVAALSQRLLDAGRARVCLNADLGNPTSNALYQRLGYRAVEDFDTWEYAD
jgi:hypothetical protein